MLAQRWSSASYDNLECLTCIIQGNCWITLQSSVSALISLSVEQMSSLCVSKTEEIPLHCRVNWCLGCGGGDSSGGGNDCRQLMHGTNCSYNPTLEGRIDVVCFTEVCAAAITHLSGEQSGWCNDCNFRGDGSLWLGSENILLQFIRYPNLDYD